MRLGQKRWRDPATAELLWHRLQWASYGASGSRPPTAALLGGPPAVVGLGSGASSWGSCSRGAWCQRRRVGFGAGASERGSGGSGAWRRRRRARLRRQRGSCGVSVERGGVKLGSLVAQN
jgi:hypothetical protein